MGFDSYKNRALKSFYEAKEKGLIDKDIVDYLEEFNKKENFYTTSSCSGRIMLIRVNKENKKMPNAFFFKSHFEVDADQIYNKIQEYSGEDELWFKLEPFILHVGCRSLDDARKLLALCRKLGIKRAGINGWGKRVVVELIGVRYINAIVVDENKVLVDKEYVKTIVEKANRRLRQSKEIFYNFFEEFMKRM